MASTRVPVIRLEHLSEAEKRAYILADNELAEKAGWDAEILAIELQNLIELDLDFDVSVTGFDMPEIDVLISDLDATRRSPILRTPCLRSRVRRSRGPATSGRSVRTA